MSLFKGYIGIDYSGAKTAVSRLKGLRIFKATHRDATARVPSPAGAHRNWTRKEIAHWCLEQLKSDDPVIIGIDHGFSFPMIYMEKYQIESWDQFLNDFQQHWPTDEDEITVIVEIFPSLFHKRYLKRENYTPDDHDAMCVAQWLKDMDGRDLLSTYFNPPLTDEEREIARLEGWILGVY